MGAVHSPHDSPHILYTHLNNDWVLFDKSLSINGWPHANLQSTGFGAS